MSKGISNSAMLQKRVPKGVSLRATERFSQLKFHKAGAFGSKVCVRSAAVPDIGLPEMLAPDPTFTWGSDRQLCGEPFAKVGTRTRPSPDIGSSCPIAAIGRTEFSIPVIQSAKADHDLGRLLCSACGRWPPPGELTRSDANRSFAPATDGGPNGRFARYSSRKNFTWRFALRQ